MKQVRGENAPGAGAVGWSKWHVSYHRTGGGHISSAFSQYLERRVPWVGIHICVPQDPGALTHREQGQTEKDLCGTVAAMMSS